MTIEETKAFMQKVQIHYWRFYKDMPTEYMAYTITEWHRFLETAKEEDVSAALDLHIEQSTFPPGIAEIKQQLKTVYEKQKRIRLTEQSVLPPPPVNPLTPEEQEAAMKKMKDKLSGMFEG